MNKKSIEIDNPVDHILSEIKALIADGTFKAGSKIPSERELASKFDTTRGYVRKALQQLELYGILEIKPQKGIYLANLGLKSIDVLISNILTSQAYDMRDLIETRSHLEFLSAQLAASRGTEENFEEMKAAHQKYLDACNRGGSPLEEDHLFHLAIVNASQNKVLQSLISMITPDIIAMNKNYKDKGVKQNNIGEHEEILKNILNRDVESAGEAMKIHMENSRKRRLEE